MCGKFKLYNAISSVLLTAFLIQQSFPVYRPVYVWAFTGLHIILKNLSGIGKQRLFTLYRLYVLWVLI